MRCLGKGLGIAALVICASVQMACEFRAIQEGEEGNLRFYYNPADGSSTFDRPLAVGSTMTIYVEPLSDRSLELVVSVDTAPPSVLGANISSEANNAVHVAGLSSGDASLRVDVRGEGGDHYSDSANLRVDTVERIAIAHSCTDAADAAYAVGQPVSLEMERFNTDGERLVGSTKSRMDALTSCQVDIYGDPDFDHPSDLQELAHCDEVGLYFPTFHTVGPVDIFVTDGVGVASGGHTDMGVHIVDHEVIDFDYPEGELKVDRNRDVELKPFRAPPGTSTYWPVCSPLELYVDILTPHICTSSDGESAFYLEPEDENEVTLRGHSRGTCEFAVEFADFPEYGEWLFDVWVE